MNIPESLIQTLTNGQDLTPQQCLDIVNIVNQKYPQFAGVATVYMNKYKTLTTPERKAYASSILKFIKR